VPRLTKCEELRHRHFAMPRIPLRLRHNVAMPSRAIQRKYYATGSYGEGLPARIFIPSRIFMGDRFRRQVRESGWIGAFASMRQPSARKH
jgi:hypothetical protein